jgi:hypothetical protein
MTTAISKPVVTHQPMHQYHLNDADRQAIIQQSSSSKKLMKIERQRLNFVEKFGCEFGLKKTCKKMLHTACILTQCT